MTRGLCSCEKMKKVPGMCIQELFGVGGRRVGEGHVYTLCAACVLTLFFGQATLES